MCVKREYVMKQKSKEAAMERRKKEKSELLELASLLPISQTITSQLDQASIIRLTLSYLTLRKTYPNTIQTDTSTQNTLFIKELESEALKILRMDLDWFLLILSPAGRILYISEAATKQIGIPQHELIGNSMSDYTALDDQECLRKVLVQENQGTDSANFPNQEVKLERSFILRLRSMLSKRAAGLTISNSNMKAIHFSGYWKTPNPPNCCNEKAEETIVNTRNNGILAVGHTITQSSKSDIQLDENTFMFRATQDLKIVFVESRITKLAGYEASHLVNKTLYQFIHPDDMWDMRQSHQQLLFKSQSITKYYRFLTYNGGWIWIQSTLIIVHNSKSSRPFCVVSVNNVLTQTENKDAFVGSIQLMNQENPDAGKLVNNLYTREESNIPKKIRRMNKENSDKTSSCSETEYPTLPKTPIYYSNQWNSVNSETSFSHSSNEPLYQHGVGWEGISTRKNWKPLRRKYAKVSNYRFHSDYPQDQHSYQPAVTQPTTLLFPTDRNYLDQDNSHYSYICFPSHQSVQNNCASKTSSYQYEVNSSESFSCGCQDLLHSNDEASPNVSPTLESQFSYSYPPTSLDDSGIADGVDRNYGSKEYFSTVHNFYHSD